MTLLELLKAGEDPRGFKLSNGHSGIILNDYIGKGGMAFVVGGEHQGKRRVAKILNPDSLRDENRALERFRNEARTLMSELPENPNIIRGFESGTDEDTGLEFIVMERVDNILDLEEKGKKLDEHLATEIILRSANGLAAAHNKGIIHRDIKPGNILAVAKGNRLLKLKLTDFGLAKDMGAMAKTKEGLFLGTLSYISPEQSRGKATMASDIYSLSATFYRLLTGKSPFDASEKTYATEAEMILAVWEKILKEEPKPLRELNPFISLELGEFISRGMAKDYRDRYTSMAEYIDELERITDYSFEASAIREWKKRNKPGHKTGTRYFFVDQIRKKKKISLIREPKSEYRIIINEIKDIEIEGAKTKLPLFVAGQGHETNVGLAEILETLLRQQRTPENVLQRVEWLERLEKTYGFLEEGNPPFKIKREITHQRLNWEKNRMKYHGVKKPVSFWKKYGWKIGVALLTVTALGLGGYTISKGASDYLKAKGYEKKAAGLKKQIETLVGREDLQPGDFKKLDGLILDLRDSYIRAGREEFLVVADSLRVQTEKVKEKRERDALYEKVLDMFEEAEIAVEKSSQEKEVEKRNESLIRADRLIEEIDGVKEGLDRQREDEIEERIRRIELMIGPRSSAIKEYRSAKETYQKTKGEFEELEERLEKRDFFSWEAINLLQRKLDIKNHLLTSEDAGVASFFKGDSEFNSLVQDIISLKNSLVRLDSISSRKQFSGLSKEMSVLEKDIGWLEENYYSVDAVKKLQAVEEGKTKITRLLENINPSFFALSGIFGSTQENILETTRSGLRELIETYKPIEAKVHKFSELRKKAEEDPGVAFDLGERLLFEIGRYDLARPYLEKSGEKGKSYLSIVRLMEKVKEPENHLQYRGGLLSSEIDKYSNLIEYFGNDQAKTPQYQISEIKEWFDRLDDIDKLKDEVKKAREGINDLDELARQIAGMEGSDNYSAKMEEFSKKAQEFDGLEKLGKKAREYLSKGTRIADPYAIWSLGDVIADVGRENEARKYYKAALSSRLLKDTDKSLIQEELKKLEEE